MSENATPSRPPIGDRILDRVIGLWTLLLLLPIAPFLLLLWLWNRLREREEPGGEFDGAS